MDAANLSQVDLAKKAKINTVQLNRILKGKRGLGPKSAAKIAKALGCTVEDLYQVPAVKAEQSNSDLLADIVTRLPTLDKRELDGVLAFINNLPSVASLKKASK